MPMFRKIPVVIEAVLFDGEEFGKYANFIPTGTYAFNAGELQMDGEPALYLDTLEGRMRVNKGDWIIKGVKGEFYPCKPDIFQQTYEALP